MTPNEYQDLTAQTLTEECNNLNYLTLGLVSEAGEVAGKVKKYIRGDYQYEGEFAQATLLELGDCLWYLTRMCDIFGYNLEDVMKQNIQKLQARKANNTIKGSGDER